jgi:hypothetical protein
MQALARELETYSASATILAPADLVREVEQRSLQIDLLINSAGLAQMVHSRNPTSHGSARCCRLTSSP